MSDGINYEAFAWRPFIDKLVEDVLDTHAIGRKPSGPICRGSHVARVLMTRIDEDGLYQCGLCKAIERI